MVPQLTSTGIAVALIIAGITMIATGEVFLAIREIALNTRKAVLPDELQSTRSQYRALTIIVALNDIIGGLVIATGLYLGYVGLSRLAGMQP